MSLDLKIGDKVLLRKDIDGIEHSSYVYKYLGTKQEIIAIRENVGRDDMIYFKDIGNIGWCKSDIEKVI